MRNIILDSTTKSLEAVMSAAVTTTAPDFVASYTVFDPDDATDKLVETASDGVLNGTTAVTLVSAPAAGERVVVGEVVITNRDSVSVTITLRYNNNSTIRELLSFTLGAGESWAFSDTVISGVNSNSYGAKIVWDAVDGYSVEAGRKNVDGEWLEWTSDIARTSLSLTADTLYYVYLHDNTGTPAVEESATAPVWNSAYRYWQKTGDATRRMVGTLTTDSAGDILKFITQVVGGELEYYYAGAYHRVLDGGTDSTQWTSVTLSPYIPANASHVLFNAKITLLADGDDGIIGVAPSDFGSGVIANFGLYSARGQAARAYATIFFGDALWFPLESQSVYYRVNAFTGSVSGFIDLHGYKVKI